MASRPTQALDRACVISVDSVLGDGTPITIRAMRPADRERLVESIGLLDADSIYTRFFTHRSGFSEAEIDRATQVDFVGEVALVVTTQTDRGETLIATGRYVVVEALAAELAFVVKEDYQGRGIASRLLAQLARLARGQGLVRFEADVLSRNASMLTVFKRCGLPMSQRREGDVVKVTLELEPPEMQPEPPK